MSAENFLIQLHNTAPGLYDWKDEKKTEGTESPIFLFQRKRVTPSIECATAHRAELEEKYDQATRLGGDGDELTHGVCSDCETFWETEYVFLTRVEATTFGQAKSYNYPEGWRVWCGSCRGQLAKLLHALNKEAQGRF